MAAAADVSFDVLLGGKVSPALLKSFKDLEELMKKQGATARTVNAVMGRAYKETFDGASKDAKKSFGEIEKTSAGTFHKIAEQAREAQHKVQETFDKMRESVTRLKEATEGLFEWAGVSGLLGAVGGAIGLGELGKKGIEVYRQRQTEQEMLEATLRGRGRGLEAPQWEEAVEKIAGGAHVGHAEAMEMMTKLAASGRFRSAEQAQQTAMSLIGLGGGTAEGAQANLAAYQRILLTGKLNPKLIAKLGAGSGINVLQQLSQDTGIPIMDLQKQFAEAKISKTGQITGGALAGAKGLDALNKALNELGQSRGMELIQAHMQGMDGLFYRFGEHWEDFTEQIGKFIDEVVSPLGDEINALIDKINFHDVFNDMIEKGKEWGHLVKAVWDTIANSPVMNTVKAMWENFWKVFTGGIELYGPYVKTLNDNLKPYGGTHMARHMTEAGRQWKDAISGRLETIIKGFTDFTDKLFELEKQTRGLREALGKLLDVLTNIDNFIYGKLLPTLWDLSGQGLQKLQEFVNAVVNVFHTIIDKIYAMLPAWMKSLGGTSTETGVSDLEMKKQAATEQYAGSLSVLSERQGAGAITPEEYKRQTDALKTAYDKQIASIDAQIKMQNALKNSQDAMKLSLDTLDKQVHKTTGNDLVHFAAAIDSATLGLVQFQTMMGQMSMFGGMGGGAGGVSGAHFTEYGPAVPGDQPGQATYDWNSYHHVGAWPGITGPLRAGDVALGYLAQAKYHVSPGQMFTDEYGRTWRFADRSGSKDPYNVDVFKGAMGGIFRRPTKALIGESGPEAVVPLSGAGAASAGLGPAELHVHVSSLTDGAYDIATAVEKVVREHWRRSAVV